MKPLDPVRHAQIQALTGYFWAMLGTALGSLLLSPFRTQFDLSNIALLYVLAVVVTGVSFGRGPAVLCALSSALCFAYVFVPPHFSFAITEAQYLLAALIMLVVALIVGHLTSRLKQHSDASLRKSLAARRLYLLARELAGAQTADEIRAAASRFLAESLAASGVWLILPEAFAVGAGAATPGLIEQCVEHRQLLSRPTRDGRFFALLPLFAASGTQGVLGIELAVSALASQEAVEYLETVASVIAVALERSNYAAIARANEVKHAAEALRSSILSALSHDLRTPLTALVGMADNLVLGKLAPEKQQPVLGAIRNQALSISRQMTNLLDMARLSAGRLQLNVAWQPIEEVLGATLQQIREQAPASPLQLDLAPGLPPVNIDAVLIERVLWNLIDNALKYSPAATPVEIAVRQAGEHLEILVCDRGPGIAPEQANALFEAFRRGRVESEIPGVGLGLSIARTIAEAHGGDLAYRPRHGGGSCFALRLPLGQTPQFDTLEGCA